MVRWSFLMMEVLRVFSLLLFCFTTTGRATIDYEVQWALCPPPCNSLASPVDWYYYSDEWRLELCDQPMLLQLNFYNSDPSTTPRYRTCTVSTTSTPSRVRSLPINSSSGGSQITTPLHLVTWGDEADHQAAQQATTGLGAMVDYLQNTSPSTTSLLVRVGNITAGFYSAPDIPVDSIAHMMNQFADHISNNALSTRQAAQICPDSNSITSTLRFGAIIDNSGSLDTVQNALQTWGNSSCLRGATSTTVLQNVTIIVKTQPTAPVQRRHVSKAPNVFQRASCDYVEVKSGDSCSSLAKGCKITLAQFESYNGGSSFCNGLQPGQYACCSSGTPPNFAPKPYSNGTCYTYTVQPDDTCAAIASAHQMQATVIENSNNNTWGWQGCSDLFIGLKICLSSGNPPFPANVANAVCGPQVNNTVLPQNPSKWADANPCPLNACCDIYGQCGITNEFCTVDSSSTGAPGTAAPGSAGCISNCGTDIVASSPPGTFSRIGYYEGFNIQRPCLNMEPSDISSAYYTHVHFAFANISSSFDVILGSETSVWDAFQATSGFRKIISFGGWAFSTDPSTYPIFRDGVTPANRQTFAQNVANFVVNNDLQGVDFDWEYPGPSIIPGIPNGSSDEGANYYAFLQELRSVLPDGYSISITAPASFYYLKNFPIYNISQVVDYISVMTYDLHGQWDYGNAFSDPGCPAGDCLRSQINMTETQSALSMITKAGVPANMIMVGQPLYGRSFQMTTAGCYTAMCTYTGPNSGAFPGPCTQTGGYISNWEINQILFNDTQYSGTIEQYYSEVAGDILVYDSTQWVSWMTPSTYNSRSAWVQGLNFGGTSDWAMDLNASYAADGQQIGEGSGVVYVPPEIYSSASPTVTCLPPCTFVFPPWTLSTMTTISQPPTTMTLQEIWPSVTTLTNGITSTVYVSTTTVTTFTVAPVTTDTISVWNVEWTDTAVPTLTLTSSVVFPEITLTEHPLKTKSTTIPGAVFTFAPGPYPPVGGPDPPPIGPPPPGFHVGHLSVVKGSPGPNCSPGEIGCGSLCTNDCEPSLPCIGICGCIGLGCPSGDGDGDCVGEGCEEDEDSTTCATSTTVRDCQVDCSVTDFGDMSYSTNCYTMKCSSTMGCGDVATTSTIASTSAVCQVSAAPAPTWVPVSGAQVPYLGTNLQWITPGESQPSTASTKTTTGSPPKTTVGGGGGAGGGGVSSAVVGQPSSIAFYTDTECKDLYYATKMQDLNENQCAELSADINSYVTGDTNDCGCPSGVQFCDYNTWTITASDVCGTGGSVGGGCSITNCTQTTKPAKYFFWSKSSAE